MREYVNERVIIHNVRAYVAVDDGGSCFPFIYSSTYFFRGLSLPTYISSIYLRFTFRVLVLISTKTSALRPKPAPPPPFPLIHI